MKTIKTLVLILCVSSILNSYAQTKDKNILKVSYTSGYISDFLVGTLKKQIQNPDELTKVLSMMGAYKVHNSFYQDLKTKESLFVVDSISEVKSLSVSGYTYFTYKNVEGNLYGKELFMGKDFNFQGNVKDLKWKITDEQKKINGYQCKKAYLENAPKVYVWFTPEIPVNGGPYMFYGLPGLILESDSFFQSINATIISYENRKEFENQLHEVKGMISDEKSITVNEVFAKKENFQRTIEKGN